MSISVTSLKWQITDVEISHCQGLWYGGWAHIRDVGMAVKVPFEGPCVGIVQYHDCDELINRHVIK